MYKYAYPLQVLETFSQWDCNYEIPSSVNQNGDSIVYIREDFTVYGDSLSNRPIFSNLSSDWMNFCKSVLNLPLESYRLHTMNKDFVWKSATGPFRFLTVEQANFYDTYGYVVIEDVFDEKTIEDVTTEIDDLEAEVEAHLKQMDGGKGFIGRAGEITFSTHLVKRSKLLRNFCGGPIFQDIAYDLIGPNVRLYWDHAVYKKPGVQKIFPWHQDNGYTFLEPQQYLTCWVALTDANENNGCFWTTPFIHKLGTLAHDLTDLGHICYPESPATAISLPVKKGGLVLISALLPHMTGLNYTDQTRKGYVIQFAPEGAYARTMDSLGNEIHIPANISNRQYLILKEGIAVKE